MEEAVTPELKWVVGSGQRRQKSFDRNDRIKQD
jgi:hypothetical protein